VNRVRVLVCVVLLTASTVARSAAAADVVLYASDATVIQGNWARTSDPTAAGGQMMASADFGQSTLQGPLAAPADYFEIPFAAPANTTFHVWFRLRATANSKYNDSVWVQYSDATANGAPVYPIGTTSALNVNLEACSGCGEAGWGWQDGAYWLTQASTIQFSTAGPHTIRVQIREDGVQIDQIVLSASSYLAGAPGPLRNDGTIVAKATASVNTPIVSRPYGGQAATIPGILQAVNFDEGGEGVAYHDDSRGNEGGAYRQTDVDIEPSAGGGYNVGWVSAGEWLQYTVNVAAAGTYTAAFTVASLGRGGTFHLEMNGTNVTGSLTVPNTGGWQSWQTVTTTVALSAGAQIARLVMDTAGVYAVGNFGSIAFSSAPAPATGQLAPFRGIPVSIPGRVEAAEFDEGGEGVAYHDHDATNRGGAFRDTGVDLEPSSEGGYDVGWIGAGEWVNYTVNVAGSGSYTVQLRVASPSGGGSLHIGFNGSPGSWTQVGVPATGGWQRWTTVSLPLALNAGRQQITLLFDTGGYNVSYLNVIAATGSTPTPTPSPSATPPPSPTGGATIAVPAGGDLQAALDAANPGDTILLTPGATYAGSFELPVKNGSSYITIRSAAADASLPPDGTRITPAYASQLPRIQGGWAGLPAITTAPGAHHYRLQFLEIVSTYAGDGLVRFGDGSRAQSSLSTVPHDLIVDRCYVHGSAANGQKYGIALNSASSTVVNSYVSDIKSMGQDTQAVAGVNGPGPFTIANNYLEASGEVVLFGGADPAIVNLVPSDITIRQNHITRPLAWRSQGWQVKNLVELKNAQRVTIDGNLMENNWVSAQSGFAIVFTPRNQDGGSPWSVVQQVQFTNNIVRGTAAGINILGTDNIHPSQYTNSITIRNNLFDISAASWGGNGRFLLMVGGRDITVDHNTVMTDGNGIVVDGPPMTGFVVTNNIVPDNGYGIMGSSVAPGNATIAKFLPQSLWFDNIFIGANPATYPASNYYPASISEVGFVDAAGGNFRLGGGSPYRLAATDGKDVGCDMDGLGVAARSGS